jgi:hypothetical protein
MPTFEAPMNGQFGRSGPIEPENSGFLSWVLRAAKQPLGVTIIPWLECDRHFESGVDQNPDDGNRRRCASEQIVKMGIQQFSPTTRVRLAALGSKLAFS